MRYMLAASLVLCVGVIASVLNMISVSSKGGHITRVAVATLTETTDAVFDRSDVPTDMGSQLPGGFLRLRSGTIKIEFFSGAQVTLTGPAEFGLNSDMRGMLKSGKLVAYCPPKAHGFTIGAPGVAVMDLGTRFMITVGSGGRSEVRVLQGEVSVTPEGGVSQKFSAGNAVRFNASDHDGKIVVFENAPIMPRLDQVALWLDASSGVTKDEQGRVTHWTDEHHANTGATLIATQPIADRRPLWLDRAIGDHPALHFGDGPLTNLQLPTASRLGLMNSDYEMFIVARSDGPETQFLIAGPEEHYELHLNHFGINVGACYIPAGLVQSPGLPTIVMGLPGEFRALPCVFNPRVDAGSGYLCINGRQCEKALPNARSSKDSALTLGLRGRLTFPFHGDIAEVVIYKIALTPVERNQVNQYLSMKYDIKSLRENEGEAP